DDVAEEFDDTDEDDLRPKKGPKREWEKGLGARGWGTPEKERSRAFPSPQPRISGATLFAQRFFVIEQLRRRDPKCRAEALDGVRMDEPEAAVGARQAVDRVQAETRVLGDGITRQAALLELL